MKDQANKILADIGQTSLTDEETTSYSIEEITSESQLYEIISQVIEARGSFGDSLDRLSSHATAFNVNFSLNKKNKYFNILMGAAID